MSSLWTEELVSGVDEIDNQHYAIIDKMSEMELAINQNQTKEQIKDYLDFLTMYFSEHFESEEKWMKEKNCETITEHKLQHTKFIKEVNQMIEKYLGSGASNNLFVEIHTFVSTWFITHIRKVDLLMISKLREEK
ncbi:MAG: hemerythrin family protein [Candidatus Heimdallarchaeota archaeon]|nr:hemerythrin family protein [Candidatus Heimdallarchaeota archaeon]